MHNQIISVFGTYDFLGKSLPGMTLIIGIATLLPKTAIPSPNLSENFLVLLSIILIVALLGTLIGEFVHSLANIFESVVGWFLRWAWRGFRFVIQIFKKDSEKEVEYDVLVTNVEEDNTNGEVNVESNQESLRAKIQRRLGRWFSNTVRKVAYVVWPYRKIFSKRISVIESDDFRLDRSLDSGFAEEFLIKEIIIGKYDVRSPSDTDQIYPVVVTTLSKADFDRAFRFQARFSFCRSMWLVLTLIGMAYLFTTHPIPDTVPFTAQPIPNIVPSELLTSTSYIAGLDPTIRFTLAVVLLFIAIIFAFAGGSYKKYYIDYLISEMYVYYNVDGETDDTAERIQRAS